MRESTFVRRAATTALLACLALQAFAGERAKPDPLELPGTPVATPVSAAAPRGTPALATLADSEGQDVTGMEGRKPTDVLRFEAIVIEGRVQAPLAIHLLDRSKGSFGELLPDESFLPRIFEAVESEPF